MEHLFSYGLGQSLVEVYIASRKHGKTYLVREYQLINNTKTENTTRDPNKVNTFIQSLKARGATRLE